MISRNATIFVWHLYVLKIKKNSVHKHKLRIVEPPAAVREIDRLAESKSTTVNVVTIVYFISNVPQSPQTLYLKFYYSILKIEQLSKQT